MCSVLKLQVSPSLFSSLRNRLSGGNLTTSASTLSSPYCVPHNFNGSKIQLFLVYSIRIGAAKSRRGCSQIPTAPPVPQRRKPRGRHLQLQHTIKLLIYADPLPLQTPFKCTLTLRGMFSTSHHMVYWLQAYLWVGPSKHFPQLQPYRSWISALDLAARVLPFSFLPFLLLFFDRRRRRRLRLRGCHATHF